jgi:hypothetical protein
MKNVGSIGWPESWLLWQEISNLQLIRNLIVHNGGYFHRKEAKNPGMDFLTRIIHQPQKTDRGRCFVVQDDAQNSRITRAS